MRMLRAASGRTSVSPTSVEETKPLLPMKVGAESPSTQRSVYSGTPSVRFSGDSPSTLPSPAAADGSARAESRTAGGFPWFLPATAPAPGEDAVVQSPGDWGFPWFQKSAVKVVQTAVAMFTDAVVATGDSTGAIQIWSPTVGLGDGTAMRPVHSPRRKAQLTMEAEAREKARTRARVLRGHDGAVTALMFRPSDGTFLASASLDKTIRVWYVHARASGGGFPDQLYVLPHTGVPLGLTWSADGTTIAVGGESKLVALWDFTPPLLAHSPPEKLVEIEQDAVRGQINGLAFSPSGDRLAVATRGNDLVVWFPHVQALCLATLPDKFLVHASDESGFSRAQREDFMWRSHRNPWGAGISIDTDGRRIRSRDWQLTELGAFEINPLGPRHQFVRPKDGALRGHTQAIRAVAWSPVDNDLVATVSDDRSAILWNVRTMSARARLEHNCRLKDCAFNAAGTQLLVAGKTVSVWDVETEARVRRLHWKGMLSAQEPSNNGLLELAPACAFGLHAMVTIARDCGYACMWVDTAERPAERLQIVSPVAESADCKGLWCVAFSPDSLLLATGGRRGRQADINLVCPHTGTPLGCKRDAHEGCVWTLQFSADSKLIVSAGDDGTARLWTVASVGRSDRRSLHTGGGGGGSDRARSSSRRPFARSISSVKRAGRGGARQRLLLLLTMRCSDRHGVKSAAINSTNTLVAAASTMGHTVYVWHVDKSVAAVSADGTDESAPPIYAFNPSMGCPTSVAFDPDNPLRLAAAFDQPVVLIWDLSVEVGLFHRCGALHSAEV